MDEPIFASQFYTIDGRDLGGVKGRVSRDFLNLFLYKKSADSTDSVLALVADYTNIISA